MEYKLTHTESELKKKTRELKQKEDSLKLRDKTIATLQENNRKMEVKYKEWRKDQEAEFKKRDDAFQEQRLEWTQQIADTKVERLADEKKFNAQLDTMQKQFKLSLDEERKKLEEERQKQVADVNKLAAMRKQIEHLERESAERRRDINELKGSGSSGSGSGSGGATGQVIKSKESTVSTSVKASSKKGKGTKRKADVDAADAEANQPVKKSVRKTINERFAKPEENVRKSDRARQARNLLTVQW